MKLSIFIKEARWIYLLANSELQEKLNTSNFGRVIIVESLTHDLCTH